MWEFDKVKMKKQDGQINQRNPRLQILEFRIHRNACIALEILYWNLKFPNGNIDLADEGVLRFYFADDFFTDFFH